MANVKIDITVDTKKLLAEYPDGGDITQSGIVSMHQKGGVYDEATQDTAKLVTKLELGSKVNWKIKGNGSDKLVLLDYKPEDDNYLKVFKSKPAKTNDDEFDGDAQDEKPTENITTVYTFKFCLKKNPEVIWTWDPILKYPFPPV